MPIFYNLKFGTQIAPFLSQEKKLSEIGIWCGNIFLFKLGQDMSEQQMGRRVRYNLNFVPDGILFNGVNDGYQYQKGR
jgi:hypothetical protein